jgi:hypothetical protein
MAGEMSNTIRSESSKEFVFRESKTTFMQIFKNHQVKLKYISQSEALSAARFFSFEKLCSANLQALQNVNSSF